MIVPSRLAPRRVRSARAAGTAATRTAITISASVEAHAIVRLWLPVYSVVLTASAAAGPIPRRSARRMEIAEAIRSTSDEIATACPQLPQA
jgi:hypothetical protein